MREGYGHLGMKGAAEILDHCKKENFSHIACAVWNLNNDGWPGKSKFASPGNDRCLLLLRMNQVLKLSYPVYCRQKKKKTFNWRLTIILAVMPNIKWS